MVQNASLQPSRCKRAKINYPTLHGRATSCNQQAGGCRGPKQVDEAMAGLMDRPESSRHELSGAAQLQQQPLLKIVTDLVAIFCTGTRYASCLRRMQPCAYLCHALGNACMATFPLQRGRDLAACSVVEAVWFPPTLHIACLLCSVPILAMICSHGTQLKLSPALSETRAPRCSCRVACCQAWFV